jgi:hypothetical protein
MIKDIKNTVWTIAGSGGIAVCWMFQHALDPTQFDTSIAPLVLQGKNTDKWTTYEVLPSNIAYLPSGFYYPFHLYNKKYSSETSKIQAQETLEEIFSIQEPDVDDMLFQRIRFFLFNHIWNKTHINNHDLKALRLQMSAFKDPLIFKSATDIIFDNNRNIFLDSPVDFTTTAMFTKWNSRQRAGRDEYLNWSVKEVAPPEAKIFYLESVWNGNLIENIEHCLNKSVPHENHKYIKQYAQTWTDNQPSELQEWISKNYVDYTI